MSKYYHDGKIYRRKPSKGPYVVAVIGIFLFILSIFFFFSKLGLFWFLFGLPITLVVTLVYRAIDLHSVLKDDEMRGISPNDKKHIRNKLNLETTVTYGIKSVRDIAKKDVDNIKYLSDPDSYNVKI